MLYIKLLLPGIESVNCKTQSFRYVFPVTNYAISQQETAELSLLITHIGQ